MVSVAIRGVAGRVWQNVRPKRPPGALRLDGLAPVDRYAVVVGLCATGLAALAVLVVVEASAGAAGQVSLAPLALVAGLVGPAIAGGLLVMAALSEGWRGRRWSLVFVGGLGAFACATASAVVVQMIAVEESLLAQIGMVGVHVLLWAGVMMSIAVLAARQSSARKHRLLVAVAAALPLILAFVGFSVPGFVSSPAHDNATEWVPGAIYLLVLPATLLTGVLVLALTGAISRVARALTVRTVWGRGLAGKALLSLVVVKLLWLFVARVNGNLGIVPEIAEAWSRSNHEGLFQWSVAIVLAIGVLTLVASAPALNITEGQGFVAALLAAAIFLLPWAALDLASITGLVVLSVGTYGSAIALVVISAATILLWAKPNQRRIWLVLVCAVAVVTAALVSLVLQGMSRHAIVLRSAANWIVDWLPLERAMAISVLITGSLGIVLVRSRKTRSAGLFLVLFCAWNIPVAFQIFTTTTGSAVPAELAPGLLTFDTVLTVLIAAAGLAWWRGWQTELSPQSLALTLVVCTVATHAVTLPVSWRVALYGLLVVTPVAYLLVVEAGAMTAPPTTRAARSLGLVALSCGFLSLAALRIGGGHLGPTTNLTDLAPYVFAVPVAVFVVITARVEQPPDSAVRDHTLSD